MKSNNKEQIMETQNTQAFKLNEQQTKILEKSICRRKIMLEETLK